MPHRSADLSVSGAHLGRADRVPCGPPAAGLRRATSAPTGSAGTAMATSVEYSVDVVVIAPRGLVALDRETRVEVCRRGLPLDRSRVRRRALGLEVGLVAVLVGRCQAATQPTRDGVRDRRRGTGNPRRTVVTAVDLESASVVWEDPSPVCPASRRAGGAAARGRRVRHSTDRPHQRAHRLSGSASLGLRPSYSPATAVAIVSTADAPNEWRSSTWSRGRSGRGGCAGRTIRSAPDPRGPTR